MVDSDDPTPDALSPTPRIEIRRVVGAGGPDDRLAGLPPFLRTDRRPHHPLQLLAGPEDGDPQGGGRPGAHVLSFRRPGALPRLRAGHRHNLSDETASRIDHQVETLLEDQQAYARSVVEDHHDGLEQVVKLLMEEETVTSAQLRDQLGPPASELAGA